MSYVSGKKVRTVLILLAAIAAIWLAGYGLFISSSTTAGTEEARLSRVEFISKADRICNTYYKQAAPIVGIDGRTPAAQASIFKRVKPYFDDAINELKQLRPPPSDKQITAKYIDSLERSSTLIYKIQTSTTQGDQNGFRTNSEKAVKEVMLQRSIAMTYGLKVCSKTNAASKDTRRKSPMLLSRAAENA